MPGKFPQQSLIVSKEAFDSEDLYDLIVSNIEFLNSQFEDYLDKDEVSEDSLRSYYVDYFFAQIQNGGFSQFVYNSGWSEDCIHYLRSGLAAIGATRHLEELDNAAEAISERLGAEGVEKFFESEYFGDNKERDIIDEFTDAFTALEDSENLIELNARWIRQLPNLVVLSEDEMATELRRRIEAIPNLQDRIAAALADEPRYMKLIRALCQLAGQEFSHVTAGDPSFEYRGHPTIAWHFITDQGHSYMAEVEGKAYLFQGNTDEVVGEIEATDEYGTD